MSHRHTLVKRLGWCWAMTSFGVDAYKASEKGLLANASTYTVLLKRMHR